MANLKQLKKFLQEMHVAGGEDSEESKSNIGGINPGLTSKVERLSKLMIKRMVYVDEFFFLLGHNTMESDQTEYLYYTKQNDIKAKFKVHNDTFLLKKCSLPNSKLILTMGIDEFSQEDRQYALSGGGSINSDMIRKKVLKVWNYNDLVDGNYDDYLNEGLTGGYKPGPRSPKRINVP